MNFKDNFSCISDSTLLFKQSRVPVFQNKVYPTHSEALNVEFGEVELVQSSVSGFVFNSKFNESKMNYDNNYQNEQGNSLFFQNHVENVLDLLKSFDVKNKRIIEIGCGKGVFFEMMLEAGIDCVGFDPTYEGINPKIIKDYFTDKYSEINADVIVMRHTLEHIPQPFSFLHLIGKANAYRGFVFIEVPTFEWIINRNAYWDIFYEHCNYFTKNSLSAMFEDCTTGNLFNGQYVYLWGDLSKLRTEIPEQNLVNFNCDIFNEKLNYYKTFVQEKKSSLAVWGAGAKGSTFLNLMDPHGKYVKYVIDINPIKQSKFIAGVGHTIYSPAILESDPVENILLMNGNYLNEVKNLTSSIPLNIFNL